MPKQFHQQRNGRRTDPPDDLKRLSDSGLHRRRLRNRLSKGSERPAPLTRAASAIARTFGSLAIRRFAQSSSERSSWKDPNPWLGAAEGVNPWFERVWYRQNTKQRADEQVSHGRSTTDERVQPLNENIVHLDVNTLHVQIRAGRSICRKPVSGRYVSS